MLTAGTLVSSTTALRLTRAWVELWADRTPPLARHALKATVGGEDMPTAQAAFRDEMIALARASAEVSWRELRKGVHQYDALTRVGESPDAEPHRPHRVKL
jgi:hypothetical protein